LVTPIDWKLWQAKGLAIHCAFNVVANPW